MGYCDTVTTIVLKRSFMKRLSGNTSKDTKIGHEMEDVIIKKLVTDTRMKEISETHKVLKCAYKVGLLENKLISGLRCSPDAVGIVLDGEGNEKPICIEVKCRTRLSTAFEEVARSDYNLLQNKYVSVTAMSDEMKTICTRDSEMVQLLHQCATLGICDGVLVIGNASGTLLKVVWINFPEDLLSSFRNCARDILHLSTAFVFEALEKEKRVEEILTIDKRAELHNSVSKIENLSFPLLMHSIEFFISFMRLQLPLKPSKRIIPKVCSLWNRVKNGSDVATQIIRMNWFPLPCTSRLPQGYVCHRLLYLTFFQIVKIKSIFGFETGDSVDVWRDRTNKRIGSFQKALYSLSSSIITPMLQSGWESRLIGNERSLYVPRNLSPMMWDVGRQGTITESESHTSISIPLTPIPSSEKRYSRRLTDNTNRTPPRKGVVLNRVKRELIETGSTPKRRRKLSRGTPRPKKKLSPLERVQQCKLPLGVHCLKNDGSNIKARNWVCKRCNRYTSYYCLGCHQHFCDTVVSDAELIRNSEGHMRSDHVYIKACISPDSDMKKKEKMFEATCFIIAHQHLYCE